MLTGYKMKMTHAAREPFYNAVYNYSQDDKNVFLPFWNKTIGECLQKIGTETFRSSFDVDTWIKALFDTTGKNCLQNGHILIITDVRFPNEADAVLERGGILIRLEGDPLGIRKNSKRDLNHASETSLDDYTKFTKIIKNDVPDLNVFRNKVAEVICEFVPTNKEIISLEDFAYEKYLEVLDQRKDWLPGNRDRKDGFIEGYIKAMEVANGTDKKI